jgi:Tfp pilus assembly protein PilF
MIPSQQSDGDRIAFAATARHSLLRRTGLRWVLSVQLIVAGGVVDLARAEDSSSPQIVVSPCSHTALARAAWEGQDPKPRKPEMSNGRVFIEVANVHLREGNYARALEQFDHAISLNPANPYFHISRGMARLIHREFDNALDDFGQAIKLNSTSPMAFFGRGEAYGGMREFDHAIEDFDEAIKLYPNFAVAYVQRARIYLQKHDYDRAIGDLDQVIKLDPHCSAGFNSRGTAYEAKGEHDRAMEDYGRARTEPNPRERRCFRAPG